MAKTTTTSTTQPKNTPLIPKETDLRGEMYFLLGTCGYECDRRKADRMMELFTILTTPAPTNGTAEE